MMEEGGHRISRHSPTEIPLNEANEMIEIFQAGIQKYEADGAQRAEENVKHDEDISR